MLTWEEVHDAAVEASNTSIKELERFLGDVMPQDSLQRLASDYEAYLMERGLAGNAQQLAMRSGSFCMGFHIGFLLARKAFKK